VPRFWSTDEVPVRERPGRWVDAICGSLCRADCVPRHSEQLSGEIRSDTLGAIRIATIRASAQTIARSADHIALDKATDFALSVQISAYGLLSQGGRDVELAPGDFVLQDVTRPFRLTFDDHFAQIVLMVPRAALLRRLDAPERLTMLPVRGVGGFGGLVSPMLQGMPTHLAPIPSAIRARVAENLLDMVATALASLSERPAISPLAYAKQWIEAHLTEDLSSERIADACKVSVRHLGRLFERERTSPMQHVWRRRLASCHRELAEHAHAGRHIGEIAFAAGFNDLSHFSRAYRACYGCAPRETRALAEAAQ
jgi:AraC-like DNA-binding protein